MIDCDFVVGAVYGFNISGKIVKAKFVGCEDGKLKFEPVEEVRKELKSED